MFIALPRILVYVAFLFLPFTFIRLYSNLNISDVLIIISFLIIVISNIGKRFLIDTVLLNNIFLVPMLIFSLGFVLSLNMSLLPYESITAYLQVLFIFMFAYPTLERIIVDEKQFRTIAVMLIVPGVMISILMIMLKIFSIDIGIDLLATEGWRGRISYGGMEPSVPGRIILQNIPFLVVFSLITKSKTTKTFLVILILINILAILLTASRSNFLTFIIGSILFLIFLIKFGNRIRIRYVVFIILITVMILAIAYHYNNNIFLFPFERYSTILNIDQSPSSLERLRVIDKGFNYINKNPFIGLGMGNSYLYTKTSLHNPILLAWVENGIFGLIGFTCFYFILLFYGIKCYMNKFYGSYMLLGLTLVMVMMIFGDMFMANSYKRILWLPALLLIGYARELSLLK